VRAQQAADVVGAERGLAHVHPDFAHYTVALLRQPS
jgi:hypothetical protein